MPDYVDEIISAVQGVDGRINKMGQRDALAFEIGRLTQIGELTEVGAEQLQKVVAKAMNAYDDATGRKPSPPFGESARNTERRAPLGLTEDGTGNLFWSLAAAIGSNTTMRGKVSREAHINRLLIVPSAPGAIITSLKIGDVEQLLSGGVPVELYGESALTDVEPDNFSPLDKAIDLVIVFQNTTAGAITGTVGTKCLVKR